MTAPSPAAGTGDGTDPIEAMLELHALTLHTMLSTIGVCDCGKWRKGGLNVGLIEAAHRAHVAAAIRAALDQGTPPDC